jgi:hypothetical protein
MQDLPSQSRLPDRTRHISPNPLNGNTSIEGDAMDSEFSLSESNSDLNKSETSSNTTDEERNLFKIPDAPTKVRKGTPSRFGSQILNTPVEDKRIGDPDCNTTQNEFLNDKFVTKDNINLLKNKLKEYARNELLKSRGNNTTQPVLLKKRKRISVTKSEQEEDFEPSKIEEYPLGNKRSKTEKMQCDSIE